MPKIRPATLFSISPLRVLLCNVPKNKRVIIARNKQKPHIQLLHRRRLVDSFLAALRLHPPSIEGNCWSQLPLAVFCFGFGSWFYFGRFKKIFRYFFKILLWWSSRFLGREDRQMIATFRFIRLLAKEEKTDLSFKRWFRSSFSGDSVCVAW